jgi:hypothetical protein
MRIFGPTILLAALLAPHGAWGKPRAHTFALRYDPKPGWYFEQTVTWESTLERQDEKPVKAKGAIVMRRTVLAVWAGRIAREKVEFVKVRMSGDAKATWSSLHERTVTANLGEPEGKRFLFGSGKPVPKAAADIVRLLRALWSFPEHLGPANPVKVKGTWTPNRASIIKTVGVEIPEDARNLSFRGSRMSLLKTGRKHGRVSVTVKGMAMLSFTRGPLIYGPGVFLELTMPADGGTPTGDLSVKMLRGCRYSDPRKGAGGGLEKAWSESIEFEVKTEPLRPRKPRGD